jgi:hypothetical protein
MTPTHRSARGGHWFTAIMIWFGIALASLPGCSGCQQAQNSMIESESQPRQEAEFKDTTVAESQSTAPEQIESQQTPADADDTETSSSRGESNSERPPDAESALKSAESLRQQAGLAAAGKDFGRAFDLTTRAWETSRRFPNDERLSALTEELAAESEIYGAKANSESSARAADSNRKLIEQ